MTAWRPLGKTAGRPGRLGAMDLWVIDWGNSAAFVSPERYPLHNRYAVDPMDYYRDPLRSQLMARFIRNEEPQSGRFVLDVDGRLVGNWFREGLGDAENWATHLSFAYSNENPSEMRVTVGGTLSLGLASYKVRANGPDPAAVSPATGLVKYELVDPWPDKPTGVMLVQMLADRRIKVETFPGKSAAAISGFTAAARVYDR